VTWGERNKATVIPCDALIRAGGDCDLKRTAAIPHGARDLRLSEPVAHLGLFARSIAKRHPIRMVFGALR